MKLGMVLVKTIHLAGFFSSKIHTIRLLLIFPCSIQMSFSCCSLKQVEQLVSHCYMLHGTIVERIGIISPHSQDLNTENRIKYPVQIDICCQWGSLERRTAMEERSRGYPASTGWPSTWDILLKIPVYAHHRQGHDISPADVLCHGLLVITPQCDCTCCSTVSYGIVFLFTLQSGLSLRGCNIGGLCYPFRTNFLLPSRCHQYRNNDESLLLLSSHECCQYHKGPSLGTCGYESFFCATRISNLIYTQLALY